MRQLRIEEILPDYSHITSLTEGLELFDRIGMGVRHLSTRTRQEYRYDLLDLIAFLDQGNVKELGSVRLSDLEAYQQVLEDRGLTVSSRNRKSYSIKVFFRFLYEQEITWPRASFRHRLSEGSLASLPRPNTTRSSTPAGRTLAMQRSSNSICRPA